jgi:hypothetical protein
MKSRKLKSWKIYLPIQILVMLFYMLMDWVLQGLTGDTFILFDSLLIATALGWIFGVIGVLMFYENPRQRDLREKQHRLSKLILGCYDKDELKRIYNEDFAKLKQEYGVNSTLHQLETIIIFRHDALENGSKYTLSDLVKAYKVGYNDFAHGYDMYMDRDPKTYISEIFNKTSEEEN